MPPRIVAPEAREDLRLIGFDHGRATALASLGRLKRSFSLLGRYPLVGRARNIDLGPGLRSLPSGGYVIIYRPTPQSVTILRVIDGRRDYPLLFRH
ncbi:type II toxin-antitoxin system RelE/ParE family toxin [Lichenibacterium ramalinae]|uniref:Type II toxin-antitoxin system RelE/ParE family toxin n=1 Tax=Lichenibacterium ramalinae TaxID=2316527 RepID=A0A4Q2REL5_9HYPH|nr:type II toxin-antitoxin system RelE/ParE family toxin [Lichenibacterium ramalinae]RYB05601.1 type II toxin-antitoxin system RelE/ParE family toxin [Lichenibacterium ramalinae]